MASIHQEIVIGRPAAAIWDAVRDVGAVHLRVAPGFLAGCRMEGDARIVTFANGMVARELIVDLDDARRRLVWSVVGGRMSHHNASLQVFGLSAQRSRVLWIADLLPHDLAGAVGAMIAQGLAAMKAHFESGASAARESPAAV